ncbi:mechanosensitive ion channel protein MscS [Mycobacterium intermedium]|uniref:Mechanosensitive ion channel protein MscS n=1 Tax=Mycobacterium intermedium TaxID=28445 RepID=A0A1E3S5E2_MYCIE|nr:mechanosensitive ion channel domain-containing protein [Mycobacterium intermedium]ODQ97271.1 mechanosensitive ion channel protein MscS [Mycobacterium intermedium]OPE47427.1 mechanosensitive ion channel protein MscS [Mycobacterium intermedium]ORA96456.1 mechanosensitive ion channel protein MscS [Mycobacterium intermedium]
MTKAIVFDSATQLAVSVAWVVIAVAAAYAAGMALSWLLQRMKRRSAIIHDLDVLTRGALRATLMVLAATTAVHHTKLAEARGWVDHALLIAGMATGTWLAASLVSVAERRAIAHFVGTQMTDADRHRRKLRTQITLVRRLVVAVVVVCGLAAILMTFPAFSNVGKTLFASAGLLSVVAGLAAQTSLGAVFAGIQIAFSDAIRVGDVVVLEDEWGRIEEITLTYVVVHLWDERRLVLPTTYFTKTPFQNWTRNATALLGTVELDVDFSVSLDDMRAELDRLLRSNKLWDNRVGVLQVTDAVNGYVRVRMLVSASDAGALFDLRCDVREGMVQWLQRAQAGALPRRRIEPAAVHTSRPSATPARQAADAQPRADSGLFSGSLDAEQRGRAFSGPNGDATGR